MKTTYKFGNASINVREVRWILDRLSDSGPSGYRDSKYIFEGEDKTAEKKVAVSEAEFVSWMARTLRELGSSYW